MNAGKHIRRAVLAALALSVLPYIIRRDPQTGTLELRSLLWGLRKTPHGEGENKDHYSFAIPPSELDEDKSSAANDAGQPSTETPAEA